MSAEVETMMAYEEPAWHGLGTVLDHPATAEEALREGGLDWKVEKKPIFLGDGAEVPRHYAMVRDVDNRVLGIVGTKYEPFQNVDAFKFFDNVVSEDSAIYDTAGSLQSGKKVWILAKLPTAIMIGNEDQVDKYVLIHNSHDGNSSIIAGITPIRVVCQNTLNAAMVGLQSRVRVRHTKYAVAALSEAHRVMGIITTNYNKLTEVFGELSSNNINVQNFKEYLDKVFPTDAEHTTRTDKIKKTVTGLFEGQGRGSQLEGSRGTLWGAYNAVTEYIDYYRKSKDRLNTVWFTAGVGMKERAFREAVNLV
jgi:phage/plasmid-like protein (TIGR03299 family)